MNMNKEITIKRAWLERLMEYATFAQESSKKEIQYEKYSRFWHQDYACLIGFLDSAKSLLDLK